MTREQTEALRAFTQEILRWSMEVDVTNSGTIQELGLEVGVLVEVAVTEPCGEFCRCVENDAFVDGDDAECCRIAPFVLGQESLPFDDGESR